MGELPAALLGLLCLPNQAFSPFHPQWDYKIPVPHAAVSWSYLQMGGSCRVS